VVVPSSNPYNTSFTHGTCLTDKHTTELINSLAVLSTAVG